MRLTWNWGDTKARNKKKKRPGCLWADLSATNGMHPRAFFLLLNCLCQARRFATVSQVLQFVIDPFLGPQWTRNCCAVSTFSKARSDCQRLYRSLGFSSAFAMNSRTVKAWVSKGNFPWSSASPGDAAYSPTEHSLVKRHTLDSPPFPRLTPDQEPQTSPSPSPFKCFSALPPSLSSSYLSLMQVSDLSLKLQGSSKVLSLHFIL